jgi:hypothetical protein
MFRRAVDAGERMELEFTSSATPVARYEAEFQPHAVTSFRALPDPTEHGRLWRTVDPQPHVGSHGAWVARVRAWNAEGLASVWALVDVVTPEPVATGRSP